MNLHGYLIALLITSTGAQAMGQTIKPELDPGEKPGQRPYEMEWAHRTEPQPPTLRFDQLQGWQMQVEGNAAAELQPSRAQILWDRPTARLRYHGDGKPNATPRIRILPGQQVFVPEGADSVDMWLNGNRWSWVNPPDTPPVQVTINLRDADDKAYAVPMATVGWQEWWLMHKKLPQGMRFPVRLDNIEFTGGYQAEWRELFLDSLRFYRESLAPLQVAPRPKRNLTLFDGQDAGANTGPGTLPFPTREQTILPMHFSGAFRNEIAAADGGFELRYLGKDCRITYRFDPEKGLGGIQAQVNGAAFGKPLDGARVRLEKDPDAVRLQQAKREGDAITAAYSDGTTLRLRIWQKSLVADVIHRGGDAVELQFGQMSGVQEPRTIAIPYLTFGGNRPCVLLSRAGKQWVFSSIWQDWYRSNGSEVTGGEYASGDKARINGGVSYLPRTDGKRNPMFERFFLTLSPMMEEVLPTIANPVGLHAQDAADRLWQESWGPDNYEKQMQRSRMLRAYGIEKLIQCNHEISWRDNGESFTLRLHAAPGKGGDAALQQYVAHQRSLGWLSGLYTNYTDFIPVNEHWDPDAVQRASDGQWRPAWPRCWALKPLRAVQFDAELAPRIQAKYGSNSAYTDVHTAVAPWGYNDYDARMPGAGTFAQTFYAYGELLRNDSRAYRGPIFSEGTYQWLYAGLPDGNYAISYGARPLATEPFLPVFDLYQIHTKSCDIGMGWTSYFCDAIPNWQAPENIDRAIDRFLLNTLAYGHIGWLVEDAHGIERVCRSYYMLQQVQARYGLKTPSRIAYWDGAKLCSVSEALIRDLPRTRRQLYVEYPGGLQLWFNDSATEEWRVHPGKQEVLLPPAGWAAYQAGELFTYSGRQGNGKVDYLRSDAYTYLDGRGQWFTAPEAAANGALAIKPLGKNRLQVIRISGEGVFSLRRPYGVRGALARCEAFDKEGKPLAAPVVQDGGAESWIEPVEGAVRYELSFTGKTTWSVAPERAAGAPGSRVMLKAQGAAHVQWRAETGTVQDSVLIIPADAKVGSWVTVRAAAGEEQRALRVRVVSPVVWDWKSDEGADAAALTLRPQWNLAGLKAQSLTVKLQAPQGWQAEPEQIPVAVANPPREISVKLRSAAAVGTSGDLMLALDGAAQPAGFSLRLQRVQEQPVVTDVQHAGMRWGIARRGEEETTDHGESGAQCAPTNNLPVGGVSKSGIFMHPPYNGGVGYTWAELNAIALPAEACIFRASVGIKDGGDRSDGVLFRVEVVDAQGKRHVVGEQTGVQKEWRALQADLSRFAGQRVGLRLIADVGPADNSAADWACWGEPIILQAQPQTRTRVRPVP